MPHRWGHGWGILSQGREAMGESRTVRYRVLKRGLLARFMHLHARLYEARRRDYFKRQVRLGRSRELACMLAAARMPYASPYDRWDGVYRADVRRRALAVGVAASPRKDIGEPELLAIVRHVFAYYRMAALAVCGHESQTYKLWSAYWAWTRNPANEWDEIARRYNVRMGKTELSADELR